MPKGSVFRSVERQTNNSGFIMIALSNTQTSSWLTRRSYPSNPHFLDYGINPSDYILMLLKGTDISWKSVTNCSTRLSSKFLVKWCKIKQNFKITICRKLRLNKQRFLLCIWVVDWYFIQKCFPPYSESRVQNELSIYYLKLCLLEPTSFNSLAFISLRVFIMNI